MLPRLHRASMPSKTLWSAKSVLASPPTHEVEGTRAAQLPMFPDRAEPREVARQSHTGTLLLNTTPGRQSADQLSRRPGPMPRSSQTPSHVLFLFPHRKSLLQPMVS